MSGLIFDLDGVVADTVELHYDSWRRLAEQEGVRFDRAVNARMLGLTREDSLAIFAGDRVLGAAARADWLARKQAFFLESIAGLRACDALPGVVELIDEARAQGFAIALASSSRNARAVLARLGLTDRFDVISDGAEPVAPKPAPDQFLLVAQTLGLHPAQCVVFEDSAAGVSAARAGGFPVIAVGGVRGGDLDRATLAGLRLSDVVRLIGEPLEARAGIEPACKDLQSSA